MNIDSNEILVNQILNICFPVGKIEMFLDNEDHSNYMGFTWERCLLERSPIGYNPGSSDDNYKTTGSQFGEKIHKLTIDEMPSHQHCIRIAIHYNGDAGNARSAFATNSPWWNNSNFYDTNNCTNLVGKSQAHNNIHPVEVVAFWRRIS